MKRSLVLKRELLSELTDGDLDGVVGAAPLTPRTCVIKDCLVESNPPRCDPVDVSPVTRLTLDYRYCNTPPYC